MASEKRAAAGERMITLTSSDGKEFLVSEAGARLSPHLAGMIGDGDNNIALRNVPSRALEEVARYCNKHPAAKPSSEAAGSGGAQAPRNGNQELDKWDRDLVGGLGSDALYDLLVAADFLGIDGLVDAACDSIASVIKAYETPRQVREALRIPDDLTDKEKEEIRKKYAWFDPDGM
jgi:S-phase kinase-associated protein 1